MSQILNTCKRVFQHLKPLQSYRRKKKNEASIQNAIIIWNTRIVLRVMKFGIEGAEQDTWESSIDYDTIRWIKYKNLFMKTY